MMMQRTLITLSFAALLFGSCSSGDEPVDPDTDGEVPAQSEDVGEGEVSEEDLELIEQLGY